MEKHITNSRLTGDDVVRRTFFAGALWGAAAGFLCGFLPAQLFGAITGSAAGALAGASFGVVCGQLLVIVARFVSPLRRSIYAGFSLLLNLPFALAFGAIGWVIFHGPLFVDMAAPLGVLAVAIATLTRAEWVSERVATGELFLERVYD